MVYQFTVEENGQTYQCERIVTGKNVLYQNIRVVGVGDKNDPAAYAKSKYHPINSMESIAKLIAREIIRGL